MRVGCCARPSGPPLDTQKLGSFSLFLCNIPPRSDAPHMTREERERASEHTWIHATIARSLQPPPLSLSLASSSPPFSCSPRARSPARCRVLSRSVVPDPSIGPRARAPTYAPLCLCCRGKATATLFASPPSRCYRHRSCPNAFICTHWWKEIDSLRGECCGCRADKATLEAAESSEDVGASNLRLTEREEKETGRSAFVRKFYTMGRTRPSVKKRLFYSKRMVKKDKFSI